MVSSQGVNMAKPGLLFAALLCSLLCSRALAADDPTAKLSGVTDLSESSPITRRRFRGSLFDSALWQAARRRTVLAQSSRQDQAQTCPPGPTAADAAPRCRTAAAASQCS